MTGIFGIFHRDGRPATPQALEKMRAAMAGWGRDGYGAWHDGPAGLGQLRDFVTPEARHEDLPVFDKTTATAFAAAARVDNRDDLAAALGIAPAEAARMADSAFILAAFRRWGESAVSRIFGDWSFAVWDATRRRLFLARDHFGTASLYYYADARVFAFASSQTALLALGLAPAELNELYLAQILTSWPACNGERTIRGQIFRLPPAHSLSVTAEHLEAVRYWRMEDTPEIHLRNRKDYAALLREKFHDAVRVRLRREGQIATQLSGGLDSSSVSSLAAHFLRQEGVRLTAFTSVPVAETRSYVGSRFGDEFPFAEATARHAGNIDLVPVPAAEITPIAGIRSLLPACGEPIHGAANAYWIAAVLDAARAQGCTVMLTGANGNAGISWDGDVLSQSLLYQWRQMGLSAWVREKLRRSMPAPIMNAWRRRKMDEGRWLRASAIHPDFAKRLDLAERRLADPDELPSHSGREIRLNYLMPGRSSASSLHATMGTAYGIDLRDPTGDARLLAFTFSVPDAMFIDPHTNTDRYLIREAMAGILPDEVRLNALRGRQAGDIIPRLRASAGEVEATLEEIAQGPAAAYLDISYMREIWRRVQTEDTPELFHRTGTVLMRGIMAGLFVNGFGR